MYSRLTSNIYRIGRYEILSSNAKNANRLYKDVTPGIRKLADDSKQVPENYDSLHSQKVQFSPSRVRDFSGRALEIQDEGEPSDKPAQNTSDDHVQSYDSHGSVNLSSVMQSTVPEPYSTQDKAPSHLNMPGGHRQQGDKYLAGDIKDTHYVQPVRKLCTFAGTVMQGTSARTMVCSAVSFSDSSAGRNTGGSNDITKLTGRERLKRAIKDYGSTVIVFHVTISLASLGGFYLAVSSGLDVASTLTWLGVSESVVQSKLAAGASTFVLAYAIHKVFAPVRIAITLTATPFIVGYLRRIGFLKLNKKN